MKRTLTLIAVAAAAATAVVGVGVTALAGNTPEPAALLRPMHRPGGDATCAGIVGNATAYDPAETNTLTISLDGSVVLSEGFTTAISRSVDVPQDGAVHTWRVKVDADPGNQWDGVFSGTVGPCGAAPTTTVVVVETSEPETSEPCESVPESSEPETTAVETTEPDTTVVDSTEPDTSGPATSEPVETTPDTEPGTTEPVATTEPDTTPPAATTTTTTVDGSVETTEPGELLPPTC